MSTLPPASETGSSRSVLTFTQRMYRTGMYIATSLQTPFLLLIRLLWGYGFMLAGKVKFENFEKSVSGFSNLGIPFPEFSVILAATTEYFGGILLIIGLGSRLVSIPLAFTMCVAYLTAFPNTVWNVVQKPSDFYSASPFTYLAVCVIILLFGPGRASIDHWISLRFSGSSDQPLKS